MEGKLICYELIDVTPNERTTLHRKLYGYTDHSNRGQYTYERPGLIQEVEGEKIVDAVILVEGEEATQRVVELLREYGAETMIFDVISGPES